MTLQADLGVTIYFRTAVPYSVLLVYIFRFEKAAPELSFFMSLGAFGVPEGRQQNPSGTTKDVTALRSQFTLK